MFARRTLLMLLLCWAVLPVAAQQAKVWRVGFLGMTTGRAPVSVARVDAFRAGLRELGYVEGKNITYEFRWADNDYERLPGLAEELTRSKIDVLVTYSTPGAMAAKKATQTIPVVLAVVGDPLASGVVPSLARPGGNITGSAIFAASETAKELELLKDAFPHMQRIAVLGNPDNPQWSKAARPIILRGARKLDVELQIVEVRAAQDLDGAFAAMAERRAEGLVVFEDPVLNAEARKVAALALRHRLPAVGPGSFAEAGGLLGYGANLLELYRRAAVIVDKILKGAKPGELPIQQASRFELVINQNTATALGISLPKQLLFRADRIIQ